ncbi:MAG: SMP-30/gluconolactonase/LRE family protein [Bacteroidales bacterium]|nr:SMP-30/gluconolactonase/LRE family protein [Bacteroidales bacterium]
MKHQILTLILLYFCIIVFAQDDTLPSSIVADGATVIKADSGFAFTEGPACAPDGRVYFTDQPNDKIFIWDEDSGTSIFVEACERSNGTYFDREGNLLACADQFNKLVKFTPGGKMIDVYSEGYDGKHLNGPNDLWPDNKGGIYFTDPFFRRDYWEEGHEELQDTRGVYYLAPSGGLVRVIDDYKQPNGIIGTPDGKTLYVADQGSRTIWKYDINPDGTLTNKTSFAPSGSDGMTIDHEGNVYLTARTVAVYNKTGEKIGDISVPEFPANVCFGGKERSTLFITARTSVYTLRMKVKGVD